MEQKKRERRKLSLTICAPRLLLLLLLPYDMIAGEKRGVELSTNPRHRHTHVVFTCNVDCNTLKREKSYYQKI